MFPGTEPQLGKMQSPEDGWRGWLQQRESPQCHGTVQLKMATVVKRGRDGVNIHTSFITKLLGRYEKSQQWFPGKGGMVVTWGLGDSS